MSTIVRSQFAENVRDVAFHRFLRDAELERDLPNAPKLPVGTRLEGVPPHLSWVLVLLMPFPATRCQKLGRNRGDSLYTTPIWEAKMEIPGYNVGQFQRPK